MLQRCPDPQSNYSAVLFVFSESRDCGGLPLVVVTDVAAKSKLPAQVSSSSSRLVDPIPEVQVGDVLSVK